MARHAKFLWYTQTMTIISFLNPVNLAQEKEKFFNSDSYHPQLCYDWNEQEIAAWINREPEYASFSKAILSQDSDAIEKEGRHAFSTVMDPQLLNLATTVTSKPPQLFSTPDISKVVSSFEDAFSFFGLDYTIEVSEAHGFNFRPVHEEKKIVVSTHLNMQFFSLDGEIKHELLHVIRNVNTQSSSIPFSANYLPTEEGLATYFQDYVGLHGESSLFQHAAEYVMTNTALHGSLRDITAFLQTIGFSKELAWQRAIRHKFGFIDTAQPGDNLKPSMYFYWQQKIKAISDAEKLRLLSGKIRLDELTNYPTYSGIIPKEKCIQFYALSI